MNVKGTAYLARKDTIIKLFGEERWDPFHANLVEKDKFFKNIIMNITLIPLDSFILFLDDVLKEFFNNDDMSYWKLGEKSAEYALSPGGPYHTYVSTKDLSRFVESGMPQLWSTYFDGGTFVSQHENNVVHITISELPVKHIYFEYLVMGYTRRALAILGTKAFERCVRGFSIGNDDIYYKFEMF